MSLPFQPIITDEAGVARFKPNAIAAYLVRENKISLNELAELDFPKEDWSQFAQLIGYSVFGWAGLSYVSDRDVAAIRKMIETGGDERDARIVELEASVAELKDAIRKTVSQLFGIPEEELH